MNRADARVAEINVWRPKKSEIAVESEGQTFIVHFEKFFGEEHAERVKKYDNFIVKKTSFEEYLDLNSKYINYFINKYDPENELVTGYLKMKYLLDEKKAFTVENLNQFIDTMYGVLFSDTLCEKIINMVNDNYLDDIETGESPYKAKKYQKSLEFSNAHIRILYRITMGMKMIAPIIYHYLLINKIRPTAVTEKKGENIIYYIYRPLFDILTDPGVNIFNKLYVYVESKVADSAYHNEKMYDQREILGDDIALVIERFIKTRLIVDNMLKYKFNKTWNPKTGKYSENVIGLNKVIINQQLFYFRKETYGKTLTEMTNTHNSEGLSSSDKMEMNLTKIDAGKIHLARINMEKTFLNIDANVDVPISEEEIAYYREHHYPSNIQVQMIRSIYADMFSNYRDENLINRRCYNIMMIKLKKRFMLMAGDDPNHFSPNSWLAHIITGNIVGRVNTKLIRNASLMEEIENDPIYKYLINVKYKELEESKPGVIKSFISTLLSTNFTYVCYEDKDLLGQPIIAPERELASEILLFLKMI